MYPAARTSDQLHHVSHPDFFGESSLLTDAPVTSSYSTITLCQFTVLEKEDFDELQVRWNVW